MRGQYDEMVAMSAGPIRTALIVVDMLADFFDADIWPESELPSVRGTLCDGINVLVGRFRAAGCPVIWIGQAFEPDLSDAFPHMRRTGKAYTIRGTEGAEILPELEPDAQDLVVMKKRFSAFFGTGLADKLRGMSVGTVVLCGVTTSWCIRSSATDAYQHGFEVLLAGECMAGFSKADHKRDLKAMDGYIGRVVGLGDLDKWLESRP